MLSVNTRIPNHTEPGRATLVFLHGLLGDGQDWQQVAGELSGYKCLLIDLPGHGGSVDIPGEDFSHTCGLIDKAIGRYTREDEEIFIIGYSLGARLAMFGLSNQLFGSRRILGYLLEGGNFGLRDEQERSARLINDKRWAARFKHEPIEEVLHDWYQQAVFSSLNSVQRHELIGERAHNRGDAIADMLIATSLAKQPYLLDSLLMSDASIHYVCGGKDKKFFELAKRSKLAFTRIKDAGHNVHKEQAITFARLVCTLTEPNIS